MAWNRSVSPSDIGRPGQYGNSWLQRQMHARRHKQGAKCLLALGCEKSAQSFGCLKDQSACMLWRRAGLGWGTIMSGVCRPRCVLTQPGTSSSWKSRQYVQAVKHRVG